MRRFLLRHVHARMLSFVVLGVAWLATVAWALGWGLLALLGAAVAAGLLVWDWRLDQQGRLGS